MSPIHSEFDEQRSGFQRVCRLLPVATVAGAVAAVALGFPFPLISVAGLLLICVVICVVLWFQSKDTERQIDVAVGKHKRRQGG